jgi:hypothetical protein
MKTVIMMNKINFKVTKNASAAWASPHTPRWQLTTLLPDSPAVSFPTELESKINTNVYTVAQKRVIYGVNKFK